MRHLSFTLLTIAAIISAASGCRQTNNGTGTGPLTPLGGLSPVTPGQAPILGPFGGTTRVTPPPTGSFSPNGTLGSVAPTPGYGPSANYTPPVGAGQANTGQVNVGAFNQPIGSGVQTASGFNQPAMNQHANWTETGTSIPTGGNSQRRDPRAGGMQVIDLTGAPNPPNYRSTGVQANSINQFTQPPTQSAQQFLQPMNRSTLTAAPFPTTSPQFESRGVRNGGVQNGSMQNQDVRRGGTLAPLPNASTARSPNLPAGNSLPADNSLNWRRPGTQF